MCYTSPSTPPFTPTQPPLSTVENTYEYIHMHTHELYTHVCVCVCVCVMQQCAMRHQIFILTPTFFVGRWVYDLHVWPLKVHTIRNVMKVDFKSTSQLKFSISPPPCTATHPPLLVQVHSRGVRWKYTRSQTWRQAISRIRHRWMSHGTHLNEPWHTHKWVMAHRGMSHGIHMSPSNPPLHPKTAATISWAHSRFPRWKFTRSQTWQRAISGAKERWMSRDTCTNESWHTYTWVTTPKGISHGIHMSPNTPLLHPKTVTMGRLRLVGSFKLWVLFAEHSLFDRALLQKRPKFLRSLLIVATPY